MTFISTTRRRTLIVAATIAALPLICNAHHSRTNFAMDQTVELEGVITEHGYRNPHVYLTLEVTNDAGATEEWLLEANAVSTLRRAGWHGDTFSPGDRVTVRANPEREGGSNLVFVETITKADGSSYRSSGLPPGGRTESTQAAAGSTDFSGVWQPDFASRDIAAGFRPAFHLPLTPAGRAVVGNFDAADDPALDCVPESLPSTILPVFPVQFSRVGDDELHIWYEEFDGRRVVYLGMTEHPANVGPSLMGHSIGQIEGNVLDIETRSFEETVWGLGRGAPSSPEKLLVERYTLSDDGQRVDVEYWFEDSVYMTERVSATGEMFLKPGYDMQEWDCDADAARRHMRLE